MIVSLSRRLILEGLGIKLFSPVLESEGFMAAALGTVLPVLRIGTISKIGLIDSGDVQFIEVFGYEVIGDGGGGILSRVPYPQSKVKEFLTRDGNKFSYLKINDALSQLGFVAGDHADQTAVIQAYFDQEVGPRSRSLIDGDITTINAIVLKDHLSANFDGASIRSKSLDSVLLISGSGVRVKSLDLAEVLNADQAIAAGPGAKNVGLSYLTIDTTKSMMAGHGIQLNAPGLDNWTLTNLSIDAKGYGLLVNERTGGSSGLLLANFRIESARADALELNTPFKSLKNTVVWTGIINSAHDSAKQNSANAGFSLGMANCDGFVAGGFLSKGAMTAGVHVEDGCQFGVLSSFVLRNCNGDGIWHGRARPGRLGAPATPLVWNGFSVEGKGRNYKTNSSGYYQVWDSNGVQTRNPINGGFIRGFDVGLRLEGPGIHFADNISVEDVNSVLSLGGAGMSRAPGTFVSRNAGAFVKALGPCNDAGTFHQEGVLPDEFVTYPKLRPTPGTKIHGFSGQTSDISGIVGQHIWHPIFPAPKLLFGRLTLFLRNIREPGGGFWEGTIKISPDVTVSDIIEEHGTKIYIGPADPEKIPIRVISGEVQLGLHFKADCESALDVSFSGTYYL